MSVTCIFGFGKSRLARAAYSDRYSTATVNGWSAGWGPFRRSEISS